MAFTLPSGKALCRLVPLAAVSYTPLDVYKRQAVVSGKGGVGKSLVTSLMASSMQKKGYHTAIMDADITGPSIPKACLLYTSRSV